MSPSLRSSGSATTGVPVGTSLARARPVLGDLAAELVAEDDPLVRAAEPVVAAAHRHLGPVVGAVTRVEIRPADPAAQCLQPGLALARDRVVELGDLELGVRAHDGLHPATQSLASASRIAGSSARS